MNLKNLEDNMRSIEIKLQAYLLARKKYRMTDPEDMTVENIRAKLKTNKDVRLFIDYHYYFGKLVAYAYVLQEIGKIKDAKNLNAHKESVKNFKRLNFPEK